jgi:hypothetical protein
LSRARRRAGRQRSTYRRSIRNQVEQRFSVGHGKKRSRAAEIGTPHAVKNVGSGNAAELATYIVEKGKPLAVQGN